MIRIIDLHRSFAGRSVLRGVDLAIPQGSTTVILGGSGSGKTVLLKHIIGLLRPDRGQVWVGDVELSRLAGKPLYRARRRFGMVFQNSALFDSMTVMENVAFPLREHRRLDDESVRRIVRRNLALVGLKGVENRRPAELSGGMRKRVGLARAIVLDPEIILYDEPTTGLDPLTTEQVNRLITDTQHKLNVTSVIISHDIGSAFEVADQIAVLYGGKIVEYGRPEQVRASTHPYVRAFIGAWFRRI